MTNEQIDELLALEAKATPGPWKQEFKDSDVIRYVAVDEGIISNAYDGRRDAALIAAARNSIRELAEEVKRLRAEIDMRIRVADTRKILRTHFTGDGQIVTVRDRVED